MNSQQHSLLLVENVSSLAELCQRAGAATSTVIYSSDRVVVYYKDPQTSSIQDGDFVDELHIHHHDNAWLLIAVFPVDNY